MAGHSANAMPLLDLTSKILQLMFLVLLLIAAMLSNGVVAYCLARKRRFSLSAGNRFLFSLTLSNCVNAVFSLPMLIAAAATDSFELGQTMCKLNAFIHSMVAVNGNMTLAMIAYDRYNAIVKPMKYHHYVSSRRSNFLLLGGWVFSVLFTAAPLLGWSSYAYHPSLFICSLSWSHHPTYAALFFIVAVVSPLIVMIVCYTLVYMGTRLQQCSIANKKDQRPKGASLTNEAEEPFLKQTHKAVHKLPWIIVIFSETGKARSTIIAIFTSYIFCWGAMLIWAMCDIAERSSSALAFVCYFIVSLSPVLHAVIYGFMNDSIRRRIMKTMCRRPRGVRRRGAKWISSPGYSRKSDGDNSLSGFLDCVPKEYDKSETAKGGERGAASADNGEIDSFEVIRLWLQTFNPLEYDGKHWRRNNGGRKRGSRDFKSGKREGVSNAEKSDAMSTRPNSFGEDSGLTLLTPPNTLELARDNGRNSQAYSGEASYGRLRVNGPWSISSHNDSDDHLLSPVRCGSRLSSVTEFTDVPRDDSRYGASDDESQPALSEICLSPESDV